MPDRYAASFRDPAGYVFVEEGIYKRAVTHRGRPDYDELIRSGLYERLVEKRWILPHDEERGNSNGCGEAYRILVPRQLYYISYPFEWSFEQLKDAALLTLRVQELALRHGMALKDASGFNVQFSGPAPVFIDTLSFERNRGSTWAGYRQFCEHFLAPLLLMSQVSPECGRLLRTSIDGIPLELASRILPLRTYVRPGALMHVHLHARISRRFEMARGPYQFGNGEAAAGRDRKQAIVESLMATIEGLHMPRAASHWSRYYEDASHYSSGSGELKRRAVDSVIERLRPSLVLDLGGNIGSFARLVTSRMIPCVCVDGDPVCVNTNYLLSRAARDACMLPLWMDLSNPSPALGFASGERLSFLERPKPDLVLALAILHHIRVRGNVPFEMIASFLARLSRRALVEFVPGNDPRVRELMRGREGSFEDYSRSGFLEAFRKFFALGWTTDLTGTGRSLFLFERRA